MTDIFRAMCTICEARTARWPSGDDPFRTITRLAEECGELAGVVNHYERTSVKVQKLGEPDIYRIASEAADVILCALQLVQHYRLVEELERLIETRIDSYGGLANSTDSSPSAATLLTAET